MMWIRNKINPVEVWFDLLDEKPERLQNNAIAVLIFRNHTGVIAVVMKKLAWQMCLVYKTLNCFSATLLFTNCCKIISSS